MAPTFIFCNNLLHNKTTDAIYPAMEAFYQTYLRTELDQRCRRNPRYSLRTYARSLAIDAGSLSRIMSGERPLSMKAAGKLVKLLPLNLNDQHQFITSVAEEYKNKKLKNLDWNVPAPIKAIDLDQFHAISEIYHYAIVELTSTDSFSPNIQNIAKRLGISPIEARLALDRLVRIGLLEKFKGSYRKTANSYGILDKNITSRAQRKQQTDILKRAMDALENVTLDKRANNSMTMAINPQHLPLAKKLIVEFSRSLCELLESGRREQVYQLTINLFPLEKLENDKCTQH